MDRELPDEVLRGQMYYADLDPVIGSEQGGNRPVLVIQNNVGNRHSPTIIIAPITTRVKKVHQPTHIGIPPYFGLPQNSMAMLEQIRTIDKGRLGSYICLSWILVVRPHTFLSKRISSGVLRLENNSESLKQVLMSG